MAASRSVKTTSMTAVPAAGLSLSTFDSAEKMTSSTLKRHPKMDLNKNDLLRLLGYLEGELQARDVVIATLKAEKTKQLVYQAKYGRVGLGDPYYALQRDSDEVKDNSFDEQQVKQLYDNQLTQLENLISTQRKAQIKMREQLAFVEKKYHKACNELEDEKRKHAQDTAQGDDVTYMLEKERERLKNEVEFEKAQNKKLEKELKKTTSALEEEKAMSQKHKQVALMLIKERKNLVEKFLIEKSKNNHFQKNLVDEKSKMRSMAEGLVQESKKSLKMEAEMEKKLYEFDTEREQLKAKLRKEVTQNQELHSEIENLKEQVELLKAQVHDQPLSPTNPEGPKSIEIKSSIANKSVGGVKGQAQKSPRGSDSDSSVKQTIMKLTNTPDAKKDMKVAQPSGEKSPPGSSTSRISISSSGQTVMTAGGTAVLTTPTGGKISVQVSPAVQRKLPPAGRGVPPPIPPNKPHLPVKKEVGNRGNVSPRSESANINAKPTPPSKFGITISSNRESRGITISSPETSPNDNIKPFSVSNVGTSPRVTMSKAGVSPQHDGTPVKRATQSEDPTRANPVMATDDAAASSTNSGGNLDFLGQEMADLQELLVSMATVEGGASVAAVHDLHISLLCQCAANGNLEELTRLVVDKKLDANSALKDGTTALHNAAQYGHLDCLKLLLDNGANPNALTDNNWTPVLTAAKHGQYGCLRLLLEHQGSVDQGDQPGHTPLYWAAANGHTECCKVLLENGAKLDTQTNSGWTPVHAAVYSDHTACVEFLLTFQPQSSHNRGSPRLGGQGQTLANICGLADIVDKDGWSVINLAVAKEDKSCLEVIAKHCDIDVNKKDASGKTLYQQATQACKELLDRLDSKQDKTCTVCIEVPSDHNKNMDEVHIIGTVKVKTDTTWSMLEGQLSDILTTHFKDVAFGLRTKKTTRFELQELTTTHTDSSPYAIGLSLDSVKNYSIGQYNWSPGTTSTKSPLEILCNNETKQIMVELLGCDDACQDSLAYETLMPITTLQNYLRLIEQYKNVVFYGPTGCGKTYLAKTLAQNIQVKEKQCGNQAEIHNLTFTSNHKKSHLYDFMITKGCLLPLNSKTPENRAPILVLDDMSKVSISDVFGDLLDAIEHRGVNHPIKVKPDNKPEANYFLLPTCYIIGTMDRTRSTGLELAIQQRFRWVHCRIDTEPMKGLLSRHLCRRLVSKYGGKLPSTDDQVYRAVEWVICVWQRLNDGLGRLEMPELVFGPSHFLSCPVEVNQPKNILRWLSLLWNHTIAPAVCEAVIKGSSSPDMSTEGQQKVASTALYVLMQRAVVSGCPLSGQEKERYLSSFHGSNELGIQMKGSRPARSGQQTVSPTVEDTPSADELRAQAARRLSHDLAKKMAELGVMSNSLSKDSTSNNARSSSFSSPSTRTTNSLQSNIMSPSRSENELNYIQRKVRKFETNSDVKSPSPRGGSPSPRTGSPSPRGGSPTGLVYAKKYEFSAMPKTDFSYSPTGNQAQSPIHGTAVSNKSNGTDMSVIARGRGYSDAQLHSMTQKLRDEFFRDMSPVRSRSPTPNGRKK